MDTSTKLADLASPTILNANEITVLANKIISRFGRYHKLLLGLLSLHSFIIGINNTVTSFHTYTPSFYCRDNNDTSCEVDDCRNGYEFESEYETLVTEFSLVCSRKYLGPLVNTLYFCGVTVGAILCGTLADLWGRRLVIITCLYVQGILGASLYFIESLDIFIVIRTIQGVFVQGLQVVTRILVMEHAAAHIRTGAGCFSGVIWGIGLIYLALYSYYVPNWHNLQIGISIPTVLTLGYVWLIPESISWLITRGKIQAAYRELIKIAKWNKEQQIFEEMQNLTLGDKTIQSDAENTAVEEPVIRTSIIRMLNNSILRKHTLVMVAVWFSVALSYYGILYFLPNLAGERHLNFGIGACIEIASYIVAYITFSRFGRRWPMVIYQYLIGSFCIIMVVISASVGTDSDIEGHWSGTLNTVLALLAKGFSVSAFCGMYMYAGELYPTGCRGAALGLCGLSSRIGSLLAPQLLILGDYTFDMFPVILMGVVVVISGTTTLFLPETIRITLPNTIDDVNELWGKPSGN